MSTRKISYGIPSEKSLAKGCVLRKVFFTSVGTGGEEKSCNAENR